MQNGNAYCPQKQKTSVLSYIVILAYTQLCFPIGWNVTNDAC